MHGRHTYIHMYIHTCIHTYTYIHTYIHTRIQVETWATNVDDAMEKKSQKLTETKGKLASERVKSSELAQVSLSPSRRLMCA